MAVRTDSMMNWLRRQRRAVELELELMAFHFDLAGALGAGQLGLVAIARQDMLIAAVELHLRERGVELGPSIDRPERECLLMSALERCDEGLAGTAWRLLEEPFAPDLDEARHGVERSIAFMTSGLGVAAAESRDTAMKAWADAIVLLRSVAQRLGVAQAEDWYLSDTADGGHLDWYDEVMALLADRAVEAGKR